MMNSSRCVDVTIHDLSAAQALEEIMHHFRESKKDPVVIFAKRGEGMEMLRRIRTELSRIRASYRENGKMVPHFGFRLSGPLNIHADGIAKEGYTIHYRISKLQQMKNFSQFVELES